MYSSVDLHSQARRCSESMLGETITPEPPSNDDRKLTTENGVSTLSN